MWEEGEGETRRIWRESGIEGGKGGEEGGCGEGKVVDGGDEWVGRFGRDSPRVRR